MMGCCALKAAAVAHEQALVFFRSCCEGCCAPAAKSWLGKVLFCGVPEGTTAAQEATTYYSCQTHRCMTSV